MKTLDSKENIRLLVTFFYQEVQKDPLIGPVFHSAISEENWPQHLEKMSSFWHTVLLGEGDYRGNPFMKHVDLSISSVHFERWIKLFADVLQREFSGERAEEALNRANKMSQLFQSKLNHIRANPNRKPLF